MILHDWRVFSAKAKNRRQVFGLPKVFVGLTTTGVGTNISVLLLT
jgi:Ca2+/Na+ antiporter